MKKQLYHVCMPIEVEYENGEKEDMTMDFFVAGEENISKEVDKHKDRVHQQPYPYNEPVITSMVCGEPFSRVVSYYSESTQTQIYVEVEEQC